jgi:hypothetical protein
MGYVDKQNGRIRNKDQPEELFSFKPRKVQSLHSQLRSTNWKPTSRTTIGRISVEYLDVSLEIGILEWAILAADTSNI